MIMGDYDLQIMVIVVFAFVLFSGFMYLYVQEPTIDYTPVGDDGKNWSEPQNATDIGGTFNLLDVFGETEIWIVGLFVSAMGIIGVIIGLRFLRGQ